jgi:hypothetical protein
VEGVKLLKQFGDRAPQITPLKRGVNERKTNQINLNETLACSRDAIGFQCYRPLVLSSSELEAGNATETQNQKLETRNQKLRTRN